MAPPDDDKGLPPRAEPTELNNPQEPEDDGRPAYAQYMHELYARGIMSGELPVTTTQPASLAAQARAKMTATAYNYVAGGAGEGATMDANRLAFRQWRVVPRMLRPQVPSDLRVRLFGKAYDCPVLMAPIGVQSIVHPDKETGLAEVCAELGVPFVCSTAASSTIEEVAAASGPSSPRWFQLYWPASEAITASLLSRAREAGYTALVVTLDTVTMGWRPADLDQAYIPFVLGIGNDVGLSDPAFRQRFAEQYDGDSVDENKLAASREWIREAFPGVSRGWDDVAMLRRHWKGPILLKGILSAEDALRAAEAGVQGVIVSNHGGRQIDGAVAALEMLPEVVDAVRGRGLAVLFDSGIRTGVDILKALALGADAVLVGRPVIYGLGIAGKEGAKHVLACLLAELDSAMLQAGVKSVRELNRGILRRIPYGGDVKAVL